MKAAEEIFLKSPIPQVFHVFNSLISCGKSPIFKLVEGISLHVDTHTHSAVSFFFKELESLKGQTY